MARASSYRILSCLGRGGFGEVYLVTVRREGGLERKRALKLLRSDLEDVEDAVARMRDEGRLLAMLDHPAIVGVEDIVRIDGRVGLLMEYVEGIDLRRIRKDKLSLPPTVSLEILATVADALASAVEVHSPTTGRPLRLVHRDIKPGNIMLSTYGRVKLLDFGVARSREVERDTHTQAGQMPLTPGYVAPEVFTRQVQEPPGDIYALGVVAFGCFTGDKLFRGLTFVDQATLLIDSRRYDAWIGARLDRISHRGVRELVHDMLAWSSADRPAAHLVRERAEQLQSQLTGPSISRWIRRIDLPPGPTFSDLPLIGREVEEDEGPGELQRAVSPGSTIPRAPPPVSTRPTPPGRAAAPSGVSGAQAVYYEPSDHDDRPRSPVRYGATLTPVTTSADVTRTSELGAVEASDPMRAERVDVDTLDTVQARRPEPPRPDRRRRPVGAVIAGVVVGVLILGAFFAVAIAGALAVLLLV